MYVSCCSGKVFAKTYAVFVKFCICCNFTLLGRFKWFNEKNGKFINYGQIFFMIYNFF